MEDNNFVRNDVKQLLDSYKKAIDVSIINSKTDSNGKIIYVNDKFCEVSKFSREELIGQNHSIVNSKHHDKAFFKHLWDTISAGETWHGEIKNKAKDGSFYWVDTVILPINNGEEKQYLSLRTLINERKELEKRKEDYIKSLEEMLFITSHKTRKPIATILGLLQLNIEEMSIEDFKKIIGYLRASAEELDLFTREFTSHLADLNKKAKENASRTKYK